MNKAVFPLSVVAVVLLSACATEDRATPAPAPVVVVPPSAPAVVTAPPAATVPGVVVPTPTALRAGSGRVESITALPPSAAAGGTSASSRRLGIKMDDGTVQYVDSDAVGVALGERVQITADGHLRRPAP